MIKSKINDKIRFKATVGIAGLVGLTGGFLFGVWDSISVVATHGGEVVSNSGLGEIFLLFLYSVSIYSLLGCFGMVALGALTSGVIHAGEYAIKKYLLVCIFIAMFVLLSVFVLLAYHITAGSIIKLTEGTVISVLSGVGPCQII